MTDGVGDGMVFDQIRKLEGWVTINEATQMLGLTKQAVHRMIEQAEFKLTDLRHVADRFVYLIRESAVAAKVREREQAALDRGQAKAISAAEREQRKLYHNVRVWLREAGHVVPNSVIPSDADIAAYQATLRTPTQRRRSGARTSTARSR